MTVRLPERVVSPMQSPLIRLWRDKPQDVRKLTLRQIVALAGNGRVLDGSACSNELRILLSEVQPDDLERFVAECLEHEPGGTSRKGFPDSGLVLQDVVNEIGRRLDFSVTNGVYHGRKGLTGYDGIWQDDGINLVIEVKTTDTYTIALDQVERYRQELIDSRAIAGSSSVLFIVGRDDTGALEAQIRGSKHAWTMRMIGAASLIRLLQVKVNAESPTVVTRIKSLLRPIEFTRIDGIVDLMFDVKADINENEPEVGFIAEHTTNIGSAAPGRRPSSPPTDGIEGLRQVAADALSRKLKIRLTRRRRSLFETADGDLHAVISVSKRYDRDYQSYWYAYYDSQRAYLNQANSGYLALCALDTGRMWALPSSMLESRIPALNSTTRSDNQTYWHVLTKMVGDDCILVTGDEQLSLRPYEIQRAA